MALKIYKIAEKVFRHNDSVKGDFVLSKFYAKEEFNKFLIVEIYGSEHLKYDINEIEVYDIGGSAETFANFNDLFTRLAELRYTAYYQDGEFIFDPNAYDLSEFRNDEIDRFAKLSDITSGGSVPFTTPENFGAVGDGITDDTTAVQNAIDSALPVVLGFKTYKVNSLTMSGNKCVLGFGKDSILYTESDATVINFTGSYNTLKNFTIQGNSTGVNQHGIKATGISDISIVLRNNIIDGLFIFDLGGEGFGSEYIIGSSAGANHEGGVVVANTIIDNCLYGVNLKTRAEYNVFSNCRIQNCTNGFFVEGGNNSFNGGAIVDCTYGVKTIAGTNDAHSQFSGTMINHNEFNVWTNHGSTYNFDGCSIYTGNIRTQGGVTKFTGCQISFGASGTFVSTTSKAYFTDCEIASFPFSVTASVAPIMVNCYKNGQVVTTIDKSYNRVTTFSTDGTFTIPKGTFIKNILIHNTTTNAITGGLRIGTTSGGQEIVSDIPIGASFINSLPLVKTGFSETADTTIYIQAVTAWNSASIRFVIDLGIFKI